MCNQGKPKVCTSNKIVKKIVAHSFIYLVLAHKIATIGVRGQTEFLLPFVVMLIETNYLLLIFLSYYEVKSVLWTIAAKSC